MNRSMEVVRIFFATIVLAYCFFAFAFWEVDVSAWADGARAAMVFSGLFVGVFVSTTFLDWRRK